VEHVPQVNKPEEHRPKYPPPIYKKGQEVYINAFLKSEKGKFFVCKCVVEETPQPNQRRVYKVKITAVADHAIGHKVSTPAQAALLGRIITKRENEMIQNMAPFMLPRGWITSDPNVKPVNLS
jgi:hypothetical protein